MSTQGHSTPSPQYVMRCCWHSAKVPKLCEIWVHPTCKVSLSRRWNVALNSHPFMDNITTSVHSNVQQKTNFYVPLTSIKWKKETPNNFNNSWDLVQLWKKHLKNNAIVQNKKLLKRNSKTRWITTEFNVIQFEFIRFSNSWLNRPNLELMLTTFSWIFVHSCVYSHHSKVFFFFLEAYFNPDKIKHIRDIRIIVWKLVIRRK